MVFILSTTRFIALLLCITFLNKNCDARTAINRLADIDVVRDDYRRTGQGAPLIDELSKESGNILVTGGNFGIDYNRKATLTERETIYKSIFRTFLAHKKSGDEKVASFFSVNQAPKDERWFRHYAAVFAIQTAAETVVSEHSAFLWELEDVVNQTASKLGKLLLESLTPKISTALQAYFNAATLKSLLGERFIDWYLDVCRGFPDVKHQWLIKVRDIQKGREAGEINKPNTNGHYIYCDESGHPIAIKKSVKPAAGSRNTGDRAVEYEQACTDIAEIMEWDDLVVPSVCFKDYTYEPFISFFPKDASERAHLPFLELQTRLQQRILGYKDNQGQGDKVSITLHHLTKCFLHSTQALQYSDIKDLNKTFKVENLAKLLVYWYLTLQGDMHGSNLVLKATQDGFEILAVDMELSLSEENINAHLASAKDRWKLPPFMRFPQARQLFPRMAEILNKFSPAPFQKAFSKYGLSKNYESFLARLHSLQAMSWGTINLQEIFTVLWNQSSSVKKGVMQITPQGRLEATPSEGTILLGKDTILDTSPDGFAKNLFRAFD